MWKLYRDKLTQFLKERECNKARLNKRGWGGSKTTWMMGVKNNMVDFYL